MSCNWVTWEIEQLLCIDDHDEVLLALFTVVGGAGSLGNNQLSRYGRERSEEGDEGHNTVTEGCNAVDEFGVLVGTVRRQVISSPSNAIASSTTTSLSQVVCSFIPPSFPSSSKCLVSLVLLV